MPIDVNCEYYEYYFYSFFKFFAFYIANTHNALIFVEGIVTDQSHQGNSLVDIGLRKQVQIDKLIQKDLRVTVQLQDAPYTSECPGKYLMGKVVSPKMPSEKYGLYWGYTVRTAQSISKVFEQCPFGVYDLSIGMSRKGKSVNEVLDTFNMTDKSEGLTDKNHSHSNTNSTPFKHLLLVFGGTKGIEDAIDGDEEMKVNGEDAHQIFDFWINSCEHQGSRTIRTEESILITLSVLKQWIERMGCK